MLLIPAVNPLNGVVRLTGGSRENTGRLEVFYSARWGTVCDDLFGSSDAHVACYQMGFTGESSHRTISGGTGPIWLDGLQCTGTETWLSSCRHNGWGAHDCTHSEDVGLTCSCELCVYAYMYMYTCVHVFLNLHILVLYSCIHIELYIVFNEVYSSQFTWMYATCCCL